MGVLHFGKKSVAISGTQVGLMEQFITYFGEVICRVELEQCVAARRRTITRNALDLHIMRLRRRIVVVGLGIRTVWGRGYVLEPDIE
jgi:DNA-binding response OmpR family regulator